MPQIFIGVFCAGYLPLSHNIAWFPVYWHNWVLGLEAQIIFWLYFSNPCYHPVLHTGYVSHSEWAYTSGWKTDVGIILEVVKYQVLESDGNQRGRVWAAMVWWGQLHTIGKVLAGLPVHWVPLIKLQAREEGPWGFSMRRAGLCSQQTWACITCIYSKTHPYHTIPPESVLQLQWT